MKYNENARFVSTRFIPYSEEEKASIKKWFVDENKIVFDICDLVNKKYHNGKKVRTYRSVESIIKRMHIKKRDYSFYDEGVLSEKKKRIWYCKNKLNWSNGKIADNLNIPVGTVKSTLSYFKHSTLLKELKQMDSVIDSSPEIKEQKTKDSLLGEISTLEKQLEKERSITTILVDTAKNCMIKLKRVPIIPNVIIKPGMHKPETAMLNLSDLHIGECIIKKDAANMEEYNFNVFLRRLDCLVQGVIECIEIERSKIPINILDINGLGDFVTGEDIYLGQARSIDMPLVKQTFTGAEVLATRFFLPLLKVFNKIRFRAVWGNHARCFSEDTLLLTEEGYKTYRELKIGMNVVTLNMKTDVCEWNPIENISIFENDDKMVKFKTKTLEALVTPDHDMVVISNWKRSYKKEIVYNKRKAIEFCKTNSAFNMLSSASFVQKEFDISDNWLELLGWILSDGSIEKSGKYLQVRIYQSKPQFVKEIRILLQKMKIPFSEGKFNNHVKQILGKLLKNPLKYGYIFYIKSSTFKNKIIELLGKEKSINKWMFSLSDRQVKVLLKAIEKGDGDGTGTIWGKVDFLRKLQALLVTHGISASINKHPSGSYLWVRKFKNKTFQTVNKERVSIVPYKGISWCVTVKNHTLFTSYNGKPLITGNTGRPGTHHPRTNFDYFLYRLLQTRFADIKQLEFYIAECPIMLYTLPEAPNWTHLITHGDEVNRYMGTPFYGIQRDHGKYTQMAGMNIHFWHSGHGHSGAKIDIPFGQQIVNGSFVGGSELSIFKMKTRNQPKQSLFGFNNTRGITWQRDIQLEPHKKLEKSDQGIFTPVWSEEEEKQLK